MTGSRGGISRGKRTALALGAAMLAIALPLAVGLSREDTFRRAAVVAAAGDTVVVSTPILLAPSLPLWIDRGTLASANQTGVRIGDVISRLTVEGATFRFPLSPTADPGRLTEEAAPALAPLLAQLATLGFSELTIRKSRLELVPADGAIIVLSDITADLSATRKGAFTLRGSASLSGQTIKVDASGTLPATEPRAGPSRRQAVPIKVSLRARDLEANFEGRASVGDGVKLAGEADFRSRRLRMLSRWLGLEVPAASDLKDATIAGAFDWSAGRLGFQKAKVAIDGNKGEGAVTLRLGGPRPAVEGTLDFQVFDLAPHIAAQMAASTEPAKGDASSRGSIVTAFDADLRLSAAKVKIAGLETGRGAVAITLASRRMQADLAELEIEGGTASGQIALDAVSDIPKLSIKGALSGIDPGRVFIEHLRRNPLMGRAKITVDGAGTGYSLPEMLASFAGRGTLAATGGKIGLDMPALAYSAQDANHVGWSAAGRGTTPYDQLELKYAIAQGAVTIDSAMAKGPALMLIGSGKVDIPGRLLDLNVKLERIPPRESPAPEILVFRGSWSDPAISLFGRPFTSTAPAVQGATVVAPAPAPRP